MLCSGMEGAPFAFQKLNCLVNQEREPISVKGSIVWAGTLTTLLSTPLFFGFSFLLPELKKRKEPLTNVTFESSVTENGGSQVPKPGLCFTPGCLQSDSWHPVL